MKSANVVDFGKACRKMIESGKCKADGCGSVPIPRSVWEKNQDKLQVKDGTFMDDGEGNVLPTTEDFRCPFLNKETYKCMIYEDRPEVCRDFGTSTESILLQCPHLKLNGNPKSEAQKKRHYRQADQLIKNQMQRMGKVINHGNKERSI